jgi:hypothetical protein
LGEGFQVCSNEGDCPSPRGDNSESVKKTQIKKKKSSPGPAGQIQSTWYKLSLGEGDLVCKNVKMGCGYLKIFSRTTEPILTRLSTNHPWG